METKAPLAGLRVVELGSLPAGAYAARLFADFGAEVIKVEPPEGDPGRSFPPLIEGGSGWFAYLNYGKKSVTPDKTDPDALVIRVLDIEDRNALLAERPDVFFITPHYSKAPYVLVRLEAVSSEQLAELVEDAWRLRAPKRVLARRDAAA